MAGRPLVRTLLRLSSLLQLCCSPPSDPTPCNEKTPVPQVVDATGAGDLFAAGFLYGRLRGYPLRRCAQIGCMAGGAVVQTLGAEMSPANWEWLHARWAAASVEEG